MTVHTIAFRDMSIAGCEAFLRELYPRTSVTKYQIDFARLGYTSPLGMLVSSYALSQFMGRHEDCEFEFVNYERHGYAAHMGFFRAFGVDFGNAPGQATGSARYVPVTLISVDAVRSDARRNYMVVQAWLEQEARRLSEILLQAAGKRVIGTLAFALTEILRNIVEHSQASQMGYCAQYWPSQDLVEVAILDSGIGVATSLSRNPHWKIHSESHALHLALLPGISGTAFDGATRDREDPWANAGFGLYMASSICREAGDFLIASGAASVELTGGRKVSRILPVQGTVVRLRVNLSKLRSVAGRHGEILRAGDRLADKLRGTVPSPSAASRLVRESSSYELFQ